MTKNMDAVKIWKENGLYVARIDVLHINTQTKTLKELKKNLKEAIDVAVEGMVLIKESKGFEKANHA